MLNRKYTDLSFTMCAIIVLLLSFVLPKHTYAAENEEEDYSLTIMHMNDTHAHVDGMPNLVTAIKEVRAENPDALLFDAGDVFSGTLYFNEFKGQADLALLNLMDVDAMVFGNHEFDLGSSENGHESLANFVAGADFPLLGTNIDFSGDAFMSGYENNSFTDAPEDGTVYDGMIKEVNGERVGIFGLTTEDTANISSPVNVKFLNYIAEAERAVAAFEEQGIDKIIAVTHIGYDSNPDFGNDLQLASYVDGIDVVVGGHSHTQLNEPTIIETDENGAAKAPTVVVQAYQYSQYLGELNVDFDENGIVTGYDGQLIDVTQKAADPEAAEVLAPYKAKVDALSNEETGATAEKTLENPRLTDSEVSVRANETELGNLVTDSMLAKAKESYPEVSIAMQNGGGIRAAIDQGPITVGEVIAVLPFGNDPAVVELSGSEIKQIMEHSVSQAPQESGGFLHVAGMRFTYDSTKEAGSRVVSMEVEQEGQFVPIEADQTYYVTTNNFTAKGGDGFETFANAYSEGRVQDIGAVDWEQLRDYMVEDLNGAVNPVLEGRITDLLGEEPVAEEEPEEDPGEEELEDPAEDPGDNNEDPQDGSNTPDPADGNDDGSGDDNSGAGNDDGSGTGSLPNTDDDGNNANVTTDDDQTGTIVIQTTAKNTGQNGQPLPNTATNTYSLLLIGGVLLFSGISILVIKRRGKLS